MQDWLILAAEDGSPLGHVLNKGVGDIPMHFITMAIATFFAIFVLLKAADAIETGGEDEGNDRYLTKGKLSQMIEVIVLYLLNNVIRPQLGEHTARFAPYLLTLFFFILFNNIAGLIPLLDLQHLIGHFGWGDAHWAVVGGTATGNIAVTAALAVIAFFVIQIAGFRSLGVGGWLSHLTAGAPWYIWPIMIPVELMGMLIKPAALAIRLFANMTAGHILLAVVFMLPLFLAKALDGGWGIVLPISLISLLAGIGIMFLELFVAFLQAFIFMFLTAMFIAQMMPHHHDEHHDEHGHEAVAA